MRFIPNSVSRKLAEQTLRTQKHSPELLLGAGVVSMVGSTILACRATLKLNEVLDEVEANKAKAHQAKEIVESPTYTGGQTYTDAEMRKDMAIITVRGLAKVAKLYTPSIVLGGVGMLCLTKSHSILRERNAALTAAYIAVDAAFQRYRERVVDRYGEDTDRELRYGAEEVDIIDEDTGKIETSVRVAPGEPSGYARWFDEMNSNWSPPTFEVGNRLFLRNQQNWANDMLRARGTCSSTRYIRWSVCHIPRPDPSSDGSMTETTIAATTTSTSAAGTKTEPVSVSSSTTEPTGQFCSTSTSTDPSGS